MKKAHNIPRVEWDFSQIEDLALADATLYEYARTSDKLRTSISCWLQSNIDGHRVCEQILARLQFVSHKLKVKWWIDHEAGWPERRRTIETLGLKAAGSHRLYDLIMKRPDFPAPWTSMQIHCRRNPQYSTIEFRPMMFAIGGAQMAIEAGDSWEDIEDRAHSLNHHEIRIKWGDSPSVNQIIDDFSKWVRREAKQHPETKPKGRPGQLQVAPLAWLSAYRLNRAGMTFVEAQEMLKKAGASCSHHPFYSDKSGWSDAIRNAQKRLSLLESGKA